MKYGNSTSCVGRDMFRLHQYRIHLLMFTKNNTPNMRSVTATYMALPLLKFCALELAISPIPCKYPLIQYTFKIAFQSYNTACILEQSHPHCLLYCHHFFSTDSSQGHHRCELFPDLNHCWTLVTCKQFGCSSIGETLSLSQSSSCKDARITSRMAEVIYIVCWIITC